MLACGQLILLDQIRTHQVVGTPAIDDDTCTPVVDDKESVKRVEALLLIRLVHLCGKNSLDGDASVGVDTIFFGTCQSSEQQPMKEWADAGEKSILGLWA